MWDKRYRPIRFAEVLGQQGSVQLLKARLRENTALDTNYIFAGGHGSGKTTLGRILARALLCEQLDKNDPEPCNECDNCKAILDDTSTAFVEQDAASKGTVDHVRGIVDELPFAVFGAPKRIYLFDECFTEDTMLLTHEGPVSIRDLVESRSAVDVLSCDPATKEVVWRPITDWFDIAEEREVVRLTFDSGAQITVTLDQELLTSNRGWVRAVELSPDDDIVETTYQEGL